MATISHANLSAGVLHPAADAVPHLVWMLDPRGMVTFANEALRVFLGLAEAEPVERRWLASLHADDLFRTEWETAIADRRAFRAAVRIQNAGGEWRTLDCSTQPVYEHGVFTGCICTASDVSDRIRDRDLLIAQNRALAAAAGDVPLEEALTLMTEIVNEQSGHASVAAIMLVQGDRLRSCVGPGLPDDYTRAVDGLQISAGIGTCIHAAATNGVVVTPDFAADPFWMGIAHLPIGAGFKGAWSMPIRGSDGAVLGTFGTYFREVRRPTEREQRIVEHLCRAAALAIERRRAESALQRSEERFSGIFRQASVGIIQGSPSGYYTAVNDAFCAMLGCSAEELMSRPASEFTHPDDRAASDLCVRRTAEGLCDRFELEKRFIRKDGSILWAHTAVAVVREDDGSVRHAIGIVQDITQRKRAEEALRRQAIIFEHQSDAIIITDLQGNILDWNPACERLLGYSKEEVLGRTTAMFHRPQDAQRVTSAALSAMEREGSWRGKIIFVRKDGSEGICETIVKPLADERGRVWGAVGVNRDISDQHAAERALSESESFHRQTLESIPGMTFTNTPDGACDFISAQWEEFTGVPAQDQLGENWVRVLHPDDRRRAYTAWRNAVEGRGEYDLEYRVRRHDGEYEWFKVRGRAIRDAHGGVARWFGAAVNIQNLKQTEQALQQANRELERFVAIASHDLKEPLRGAATLASFILEDDAGISGETRGRLERTTQLCERLIGMVNGLLEYARSSGERLSQPCDLEHIARSAIDKMAEHLRARNAQVTVHGPFPLIDGDPVLLERMFANLIANGIKYNASEPRRVEIGMDGDRIYVRDNGLGIDPKYHERIFELFKRVGSGGDGGSGLGLALVRNIVRSHGGHVWVESRAGEGSTFHIRFDGSRSCGSVVQIA